MSGTYGSLGAVLEATRSATAALHMMFFSWAKCNVEASLLNARD